MITAEEKIKRQQNGNIHRYIYYHCTKRMNKNCTQKCIEQKKLEGQIKEAVDDLTIPIDLHEYGLKWVKKNNANKAITNEAVLDTQNKAYKECLKKISGLIDMRAGQEISKEEFEMKKEPLMADKKRWENVFNKTGNDVDAFVKKADEVFDFAKDAKAKLEKGEMDKKSVLSRLGSNLFIKDKMIAIDLEHTLIPLKDVVKENKRLEPLKIGLNRAEIEELYAKSPTMQWRWDSDWLDSDWHEQVVSVVSQQVS